MTYYYYYSCYYYYGYYYYDSFCFGRDKMYILKNIISPFNAA